MWQNDIGVIVIIQESWYKHSIIWSMFLKSQVEFFHSCLKSMRMLLKDRMDSWGWWFTICPNPNISAESLDIIRDSFWKKFDNIQNNIQLYGYQTCWVLNPDSTNGNFYLWHQFYILLTILHFCPWFCCLPCNFKRLGIGSVERLWANLKLLEEVKQPNLVDNSLEKETIFYTWAILRECHIKILSQKGWEAS